MSPRGQDAADQGAGSSSSGLSLRERMRLKAQQKLQDQAGPSSSSSSRAHVPFAIGTDVGSEDEALESLTFKRTKRKAALDRPTTYSIDPTDDASRLKRHPNMMPASVAQYAATPVRKAKEVNSMLREQQRRVKRGTDADGFSRADAIARNMEQERLGRLGIAFTDSDSDGEHGGPTEESRASKATTAKVELAQTTSHRNAYGEYGREQDLTVRELSPTIPSFMWSSQSDGGDSDSDMSARNDSGMETQRLVASLAAVDADEEDKQQTLDILQQDVGRSHRDTAERSNKHIIFYKPGKRVVPPTVSLFCDPPTIPSKPKGKDPSASSQASQPSAAAQLDWESRAKHILLAGVLPPSLELDARQIRSIISWLAISFILERNIVQSQLIMNLFQRLLLQDGKSLYAKQLDSAMPKALSQVVEEIPRLLVMLGMDETVFEGCFPDDRADTHVPCFTVGQRKPSGSGSKVSNTGSSASAENNRFKAYLTQAERDDVLINLARLLQLTIGAPSQSVDIGDHLSIFAGYVTSMILASAASTSFTLQQSVGEAFGIIFTTAAEAGGETLRKLQEQVCRRTFTALGMDSLVVRTRVVATLPGEGREIGAVKRWLAWCALTEHVATAERVATDLGEKEVVPSSDPLVDDSEECAESGETSHWRRTRFEPLTLDLELVARAIDSSDASSPFYIAPPGSAKRPHRTDIESLIAATQLVAILLSDLPIHMCTFSTPTTDRSTPTPSNPNPIPVDPKPWPRPLQLALKPYLSLNPHRNQSRTTSLHTITQRLAHVNSRIRDNSANVILHTLAKDLLQRTGLALEYQLRLYTADNMGSIIR